MIKLGIVLMAGTLTAVSLGGMAGMAPKASAASANSGVQSAYNKNSKVKNNKDEAAAQADVTGENNAQSQEQQPADQTGSDVEKIISDGMKYLGTPYEFGSDRSDPSTFDCSDFLKWIFKEAADVILPSDSRSQGEYVKAKGDVKTDWHDLKRGDLMFFMSYKGTKESDYSGIDKSSQKITHTGIYLGDGKVLHTYSVESGGVTVSSIEGTHFEYRFLYGGSAL